MTPDEHRAYVIAIVDGAPPLTTEQRARLAPIVRRGMKRLRAQQSLGERAA